MENKSSVNKFITELALEKGFCQVGFCSGEPFFDIKPYLENSSSKLLGFVESDVEKRINPSLTMEGCKSIIVFAKNYRLIKSKNSMCYEECKISNAAVGEDYHVFMKRELGYICEILEKKYGCKADCFSDTGPLCDRELAFRGGLGYIGKNTSLITESGGNVFIGYILTNLELEHNTPVNKACNEKCRACFKACPTGAINDKGFKIEKCISFITQKKGVLTYEEMKYMGNNIYGCDLCQEACPQNNEIIISRDMKNSVEFVEILSLSNKEFNEKFGKTAMGWRGNTIIKRNALIAVSNIAFNENINLVENFLNSENKLLKETAIKLTFLLDNTNFSLKKSMDNYEGDLYGLLELKRP